MLENLSILFSAVKFTEIVKLIEKSHAVLEKSLKNTFERVHL